MISGPHRPPRFTLGRRLAAALLVGAALPAQSPLAALVAEVEQQGQRAGVVVVDVRSGDTLYAHRAAEAFVPASNQKLLTVAAALWSVGPEARFETRFTVRDGILRVHAGGDPNWITEEETHAPAEVFGKLAAALRRRGVERLRGVELVHGTFTGPLRPEGWPADQFDRDYCAPTGGLVLEAATFRARIAPGAGSASVSLVWPPADVSFGGRIRMSRSAKRSSGYWISQGDGAFRGHGTFRVGARAVEVEGVCQEPAWLFERTLVTVLRDSGIAVAGEEAAPVQAGALQAGALQAGAGEEVEVFRYSTPLEDAFDQILRHSSNHHAEQLLRVLGDRLRGDGSIAGGRAAVRGVLGNHVELPEDLHIADGSGMSRDNRVSPEFLCTVMRAVCTGPHGKVLVRNLARGGVDGTLRNRFRRAPELGRAVFAKTGTLRAVKALSGLVRLPSGRLRLFSIVMNRRSGSGMSGVARLQERMVQAIYEAQE